MSQVGHDEIAIIGSGGIGGFLAGQLADAGRPVTMCVRTPFETLTIEQDGRTRDVAVRQASDPDTMGPVGWVLITTKAQDTAGAAPWLARLVGPDTVVVVIQNGVGHVERARPVVGASTILPAVIYCSVERTAPGRIVHHGGTRIVVPKNEGSAGFAKLFDGTAFTIEESDDFTTVAWRKLFNNLVGNSITALTIRRTDVFADPAIRDLSASILAEAIDVAQAEGAALTQTDADRALSNLGGHGGTAGTSMLYDRLAGRPLEHRFLTGALVEAADRHGIAVPVNRALLALLGAVSGQKLDEVG